jgi:D-sedoheptulose 7-phosphate isomerase
MEALCDVVLRAPHPSTPLIQEVHISAGHLLCALVDHFLFENVLAILPMLREDNAP